MNIEISQLIGYKVKTIDGEYGVVNDFLFSDQDHVVRYIVIDPQKWNPLSNRILITPISVYYVNIDSKELCLSIDTEQLKASPGIEEHETVSRHFESKLYQYYGYGYYWMGADLWGMGADPTSLRADKLEASPELSDADSDIHLRAISEVSNYNVATKDGPSFSAKSFVFDSKRWALQFAIIDCAGTLSEAQPALVKIQAIDSYEWHEQTINLNITSQQLKANPHFESALINSDKFLKMMELSPIKLE